MKLIYLKNIYIPMTNVAFTWNNNKTNFAFLTIYANNIRPHTKLLDKSTR
jgi:hypothetical protein